jgi:hypothetical protein
LQRHRQGQHREIDRQQPPCPAVDEGPEAIIMPFQRIEHDQPAQGEEQIDRRLAMVEQRGKPRRDNRTGQGVTGQDIDREDAAQTIHAGKSFHRHNLYAHSAAAKLFQTSGSG